MRIEGKRTRFGKQTEVDEKHGKKLDMSGMSLDSIPNPIINLSLVTKLDLSNNNLEVISLITYNYPLFQKICMPKKKFCTRQYARSHTLTHT